MTDLGEQLAKALGLTAEMTQMIVDTATEYVKTQRPDLSEQVDALLTDRRKVSRAARLIARWGRQFDPRQES